MYLIECPNCGYATIMIPRSEYCDCGKRYQIKEFTDEIQKWMDASYEFMVKEGTTDIYREMALKEYDQLEKEAKEQL